MTYYEWAEDLAIDHGHLDDDHHLLVKLANQLHDATSRGEGRSVVGGLMTQVMNSTLEHVQREENLMEALGYPRLAEHRQGHLRFIEELRFLQHRYQSGSIVVAAEFSTLLRDWLSLHVRRQDKDLLFFQQSLERARRHHRSEEMNRLRAEWLAQPHEQRNFDRRHARHPRASDLSERRLGERRTGGLSPLAEQDQDLLNRGRGQPLSRATATSAWPPSRQ